MTREEKERKEKKIISSFITHFSKHKLDINDENELVYIKKALTDVFRLEIEELGYKIKGEETESEKFMELSFINSKDESAGTQQWEAIELNLYELLNDLNSDNKLKRIFSCIIIFQNLFHEIQHQRQDLLIRLNICSRDAMLYAKEQLMCIIMDKDFYNYNYDSFAMENNADSTARTQIMNLLSRDFSSISIKYRDYEQLLFELAIFTNKIRLEPKIFRREKIEREDLFERTIKRIYITEENLSKYPILSKEYKVDAHFGILRRSSLELIKNMKNEINQILRINDLSSDEKQILIREIKSAYFEMIYRSLYSEFRKKDERINDGLVEEGLPDIIRIYD